MSKKEICQECWEVFLANMFKSIYFDEKEFIELKKYDGLGIETLMGNKIRGEYKGLILKFIDYKNPPSQEEFDYLKKNKSKYFFCRKTKSLD